MIYNFCICFEVDEFVKGQKLALVVIPSRIGSGMTTKPESSLFNRFWTPAFAGVTNFGTSYETIKVVSRQIP